MQRIGAAARAAAPMDIAPLPPRARLLRVAAVVVGREARRRLGGVSRVVLAAEPRARREPPSVHLARVVERDAVCAAERERGDPAAAREQRALARGERLDEAVGEGVAVTF